MLGLNYVPGDHGSPVRLERNSPWDFCDFSIHIHVLLSLVTFPHGPSRCHRDGPWGRFQGELRWSSRSTTDVNTFSPDPHVLTRCLTFLTFLSRPDTFLTVCQGFLRKNRGGGTRLSPRLYKNNKFKIKSILRFW